MIKNYLITALRTLRRNKLFAMINVLGLSLGISAATTISWWIYALRALIILVIALLTLFIQTIRAANANPVESLRTE